ncbi:MAG: protein-L-isoaspartate O-methyltransferase, partial [Thermomicrobiales bacterium]|nr:protein-L-isoaspartate O-methyltransferase [Thermomicrobiales bacterium]
GAASFMADFAVLRAAMVEGQIRTVEVNEPRVLEAFRQVPRERFVPARQRSLAYADEHLVLKPAEGGAPARSLIAPAVLARLIQAAEIAPAAIVLDVGAATGYAAAILSRLANSVVALEPDADLAGIATENLVALDVSNVAVLNAPLAAGFAEEGPYDAIVVEGAVDEVPAELLAQIKEGGRLVAMVGRGQAAAGTVYLRSGGEVSARSLFNAGAEPLPGFERSAGFVF